MQRKVIHIPSTGRPIKALVLGPDTPPSGPRAGVLWLHGGGYATGMAEMALFSRPRGLVERFGVTVLAPSYRLSVEAPYPAALEDCHAALVYLRDHAAELSVRDDQIFVGGESAGGGLTAALCMYERDTDGVRIAYQMPLYPMIDDRDTPSSRNNRERVWNTRRNHAAWRLYLRGLKKEGAEVPPYAAPARQTDYAGLPPTYTYVGDIEPFLCETLEYVGNLRRAGVEAKLDVYPDWYHAYDLFHPKSPAGRRAIEAFEKSFEHAMGSYFAPQPE